MLERAFLLRSCSDTVFESRTRPCLLHQIKRCSAPCTGEIGLEDYGALVEEATRFLRGESQNARQMYQRLMQEAAANLDFEQAAKYRNRLWALAHVTADQTINPEGIEEADVFAAASGRRADLHPGVLLPRRARTGATAPTSRAPIARSPVEEVLESFIAQFYDDKPVPRCILLSHDLPNRELLAEALSHQGRAQGRDPRAAARRQDRHRRARRCRTPARRWAAGWPRAPRSARLLEGLAERFGLATRAAPHRGVRQQPHPGHATPSAR